MIRSYILSFALVMLASSMNAQQDPQFTQWYMDHVTSNIAAAGQSDLTNVNAFYRNQWVGLDRAPVTTLMNVDTRLGDSPFGLGLQFYQDELGNESNTMVKLGGSFSLDPFSGGSVMSFGTSVSVFSKRLGANYDWIAIDDPASDNSIPNENTSDLAIDLDFGFYLHKPNKYYAGISTTHILQNSFDALSIQAARHYYFMGGYNFNLDGDFIVLRTNFLTKTDFAATAIDFNTNVLLNDMIWGGVSFRPGDAVAPVLGFQHRITKKEQISSSEQFFRLGYSYDITTSELQTYSNGSHEIFLSYSFKFESTPIQNKYANPRFL